MLQLICTYIVCLQNNDIPNAPCTVAIGGDGIMVYTILECMLWSSHKYIKQKFGIGWLLVANGSDGCV